MKVEVAASWAVCLSLSTVGLSLPTVFFVSAPLSVSIGWLSVWLCRSLFLSVCMSVCLSVSLSLSACLPACLSLSLSSSLCLYLCRLKRLRFLWT